MCLILHAGVTPSGFCHFSGLPGSDEATQAHQSPGGAVNPSLGLSPGAVEIKMGNVTFFRQQGSSWQSVHLSIHAGYESYMGITHMYLVRIAAKVDVFELWEGKKGRDTGS